MFQESFHLNLFWWYLEFRTQQITYPTLRVCESSHVKVAYQTPQITVHTSLVSVIHKTDSQMSAIRCPLDKFSNQVLDKPKVPSIQIQRLKGFTWVKTSFISLQALKVISPISFLLQTFLNNSLDFTNTVICLQPSPLSINTQRGQSSAKIIAGYWAV